MGGLYDVEEKSERNGVNPVCCENGRIVVAAMAVAGVGSAGHVAEAAAAIGVVVGPSRRRVALEERGLVLLLLVWLSAPPGSCTDLLLLKLPPGSYVRSLLLMLMLMMSLVVLLKSSVIRPAQYLESRIVLRLCLSAGSLLCLLLLLSVSSL